MGSNSSSTMLGRNILLLVFYLAFAGVNSADDNCSNSDNCNAEAGSRVKIICDNETPEVKCTCEGNVENSELFTKPCEDINGLLTVDITFNNMDAAMCEDLCKADNKTDACKFFKLVEENKYQGGDRVCYLMSGDQCNGRSNTTCDSGHCSSGGIACDGTNPTTTTPKPDSEKVDCQTSPLLKHNDDGEHLRWRCMDNSEQVPIYDAKYYANASSFLFQLVQCAWPPTNAKNLDIQSAKNMQIFSFHINVQQSRMIQRNLFGKLIVMTKALSTSMLLRIIPTSKFLRKQSVE